MSERIRELAAEAEDYADSIVDQGGEFHLTYTQKFAELIVKEMVEECAKVCVEHAGWTPSLIANQVKKHFGVES